MKNRTTMMIFPIDFLNSTPIPIHKTVKTIKAKLFRYSNLGPNLSKINTKTAITVNTFQNTLNHVDSFLKTIFFTLPIRIFPTT